MVRTNPPLPNTEASDVIMKDSDSITPSEDFLQQIFNDQRELRKESSGRNAPEDHAGPTVPQAAVEVSDENVQTNSNRASPTPHQGSHLPPPPVPRHESSMSGLPPNNPSTMESARELSTNQHQAFFDEQREKLQSQYEGEMKKLQSQYEGEMRKLKDSLATKTGLWEDAQKRNVELTRQLSEQALKMTNLQKIMVRAGRSDRVSDDNYINGQFLQLKNDILQMVKNHLGPRGKPYSGASPELSELWLRAMVASTLYAKFFSRDAMLFGFEDELFDKSPMRIFEEKLRRSRYDEAESILKEWRVATVKAGKLLKYDSSKYLRAVSKQIWKEGIYSYCHHPSFTPGREKAHMDLDNLCRMAADLAILFRGSTIEYEWEQDDSHLRTLDVVPKSHEVVGVDGPDPDDEANCEISFIVFGGVVRGDKNTGSLEYGRTQLSETQVVVRRRASESLSHGVIS